MAAVSANEGGTLTNSGTFSAPQGNSTAAITASIGTVTQNNANGTWSLYVLDENTSGSGTISGGWNLTITAKPAPLSVTTTPATSVSSTSVTLNGLINPLGSQSVWAFQFGTSSTYSDTQRDRVGGAGTIEFPVNLSLVGLTPGTTYHFRVTGRNGIKCMLSVSTPAGVESKCQAYMH